MSRKPPFRIVVLTGSDSRATAETPPLPRVSKAASPGAARKGWSAAPATAWIVFAALQVAIHRERIDSPRSLLTGAETGSIYVEGARNDLRLGLMATSGVPMIAAGERRPEEFTFYPNHPPLLVHGVATVAATGLEVLTAGRVFMILSWSAAATAVFLLGRRSRGPLDGWIAGLLVVLSSGVLHGGLFVEVVTGPVVPFSLWAVVAYLDYRDRPSPVRAAGVFLLSALAGLSDWPGLLVSGFIFLDRALVDRRWRDPLSLLPLVPAGIVLAWRALTLHARAAAGLGSPGGDPVPGFVEILAGRINEGPVLLDGSAGPGAGEILAAASGYTFGVGVSACALLGVATFAFRVAWRRDLPGGRGLLLAVLAPATYLAVFFRGAVIHPFWTLSVVPGLALLASTGLHAIAGGVGSVIGARGGRVILLLLAGSVLALELRSGLRAIEEQDARSLGADARLIEVAATVRPFLEPPDRLAVVGDGLRADHLGWHLDRETIALHPSPEGLVAFRKAYSGRSCVLVSAAEAFRLPALAVSLADFPYAAVPCGGAPVMLFDLGNPPRLRDRLSAAQKSALLAMEKAAPGTPPEVAFAPDSRTVRIDPSSRGGDYFVRVGLQPFQSLPLCAIQGGTDVPLERFPPGVAYISVSRAEGAVERVSAPVRVEKNVDDLYLWRGALTGLGIGGGAVLLFLLAARRSAVT